MTAMLWAVAANAAELLIGPEKFRTDGIPLNGATPHRIGFQGPEMVGVFSMGTPPTVWYGWAPVNLPVGSVIKSVHLQYGGSTADKITNCQLMRVKFGKAAQLVAFISTSNGLASDIPLTINNQDWLVIQEDFRYFIRIYTGIGTTIFGVKITY